MSSPQDDGSDNEGIEFENYAESDDDDEDPYFMAVHRKKSRTFSYKWYACSLNLIYALFFYLVLLPDTNPVQ